MRQSVDPGHEVLRTFVVLVAAGSQKAAARELGLAVPTVSLHVRALEDALGVRLFEKIGRRAVPTEEARELATRLGDALAGVRAALEETREQRNVIAGSVRIGAPRPFGQMWLTTRLAQLLREHPALIVDVLYGGPSELEGKLREGALDLAILVREPERPGLETREVHRERFVAVCAPQEPTVGEKSGADLDEALSHRWIAFDEDLPMHLRWWRATFGPRARLPSIAAYVRDLVAMRDLVEAGAGLAVLPDYMVEDLIAAGRLREVYPRSVRRVRNSIVVAWRSGATLHGRHGVVRDALVAPRGSR